MRNKKIILKEYYRIKVDIKCVFLSLILNKIHIPTGIEPRFLVRGQKFKPKKIKKIMKIQITIYLVLIIKIINSYTLYFNHI